MGTDFTAPVANSALTVTHSRSLQLIASHRSGGPSPRLLRWLTQQRELGSFLIMARQSDRFLCGGRLIRHSQPLRVTPRTELKRDGHSGPAALLDTSNGLLFCWDSAQAHSCFNHRHCLGSLLARTVIPDTGPFITPKGAGSCNQPSSATHLCLVLLDVITLQLEEDVEGSRS